MITRTKIVIICIVSIAMSGHCDRLSTLMQEQDSLLWAISQVESGGNDHAVGRSGEVSRYQIKKMVWRKYSRTRNYSNPSESRRVAIEHLKTLERTFRSELGEAPTELDLAVMWQSGFDGYRKSYCNPERMRSEQRDRLRRIINLIEEHERRTASNHPVSTKNKI